MAISKKCKRITTSGPHSTRPWIQQSLVCAWKYWGTTKGYSILIEYPMDFSIYWTIDTHYHTHFTTSRRSCHRHHHTIGRWGILGKIRIFFIHNSICCWWGCYNKISQIDIDWNKIDRLRISTSRNTWGRYQHQLIGYYPKYDWNWLLRPPTKKETGKSGPTSSCRNKWRQKINK
jgi:hypothetical protein